MNESKIVATKRLQSEGLWNEASLYREEVREHLRGEGMTRKEANRGAWERDAGSVPTRLMLMTKRLTGSVPVTFRRQT